MIEIVGVYSSVNQLLEDINERFVNNQGAVKYFTVDSRQYQELRQNSSLTGTLMDTSENNEDGGIHSLATAFDEDDGSVELIKLEKELLQEGFSKEDANECKAYLHKGMIVAAEKV
ncbi:hypothetical protein D3H55_02635 [Bacillus salacetis]|uniref:Uncharacterized protein n=1 Tax=Bacillus salacetis TaxID=2315464 RepID=A0A3A1RAM8_9BACI|nr:hypothetical protein [Bacillus salacetis]RIW38451.1 hypothetical protein D3H55_02635 [Bacillus salacetis]